MRKFHKTAFCLLFVIVFAFLAAACTGSKKETLSPEEVQQLQEAHPQFFGLDTSDGLPDEKITLRPYDSVMASSYTLSMLMEDGNYLTEMAEAFDNRYRVGEVFKCVYDPEIDK